MRLIKVSTERHRAQQEEPPNPSPVKACPDLAEESQKAAAEQAEDQGSAAPDAQVRGTEDEQDHLQELGWYTAKNEVLEKNPEDEARRDDGKIRPEEQRHVGLVKSFHEGVGIGFIQCETTREALGRSVVSVDRAEISGFEVGDIVTFELGTDPELGTPKAVHLEAAPNARFPPGGSQAQKPQLSVGSLHTGIVKAFDRKLGIGQLACEGVDQDILVLAAELAGFSVGDRVSFRLSSCQLTGKHLAIGLEAEVEVFPVATVSTRGDVPSSCPDRVMERETIAELNLASRTGDKACLQRALARARRVGVHGAPVAEAERRLRRLVVAQRLQAVVSDRHAAPLRERCATALAAGLESDLLADAEALLSRRSEAVEELRAAVASQDEVSLRLALAQARASGVQKSTLQEARTALRRVRATRTLAKAVSGMDEVALRLSLARAREYNIQTRNVSEAEGALRRISAINELAEAVCGTDESALSRAIARARDAGLQAGTLQQADRALQRLTAARELSDAVDKGDLDVLRTAIQAARTAGVALGELQLAESMAGRLSAKAELDNAVSRRDDVALKVAISLAEEVGVSGSAIESARHTLRRIVAERELDAAVASGDEEFLQKALLQAAEVGMEDVIALDLALDIARAKGMPRSVLDLAEAALERSVAAENLAEAARAGDEGALENALEVARDCQVEAPALEAAEQLVHRLIARRSLQAALELAASLELTGTFDEEGEGILSEAAGEVATFGEGDELVAKAQQVLKKAAAARKLSAALDETGPDALEQLEVALEEALAVGVEDNLQRVARIRIKRLAASSSCRAPGTRGAAMPVVVAIDEGDDEATLAAQRKRKAGELGEGDCEETEEEQLARVQAQKREAVAREDFERAAELRELELELLVRRATTAGQVS